MSHALATAALGPFQLQAAIAAVHAEAPHDAATDRPQIAVLYRLLDVLAPGPMVMPNRAVAEADGPAAGLTLLAELDDDERMTRHHRLHAVRAHLLELAGDEPGALAAYRRAAQLAAGLPERRYLQRRAARVNRSGADGPGISGAAGRPADR